MGWEERVKAEMGWAVTERSAQGPALSGLRCRFALRTQRAAAIAAATETQAATAMTMKTLRRQPLKKAARVTAAQAPATDTALAFLHWTPVLCCRRWSLPVGARASLAGRPQMVAGSAACLRSSVKPGAARRP